MNLDYAIKVLQFDRKALIKTSEKGVLPQAVQDEVYMQINSLDFAISTLEKVKISETD